MSENPAAILVGIREFVGSGALEVPGLVDWPGFGFFFRGGGRAVGAITIIAIFLNVASQAACPRRAAFRIIVLGIWRCANGPSWDVGSVFPQARDFSAPLAQDAKRSYGQFVDSRCRLGS